MNYLIRLLISLLVTCTLLCCSTEYPDKKNPTTFNLSVNGELVAMTQTTSDTIIYDLTTLNTQNDAVFIVPDFDFYDEVSINGKKITSNTTSFRINKIKRGDSIRISWAKDNKETVAFVRTMSSIIPQFDIKGKSETEGHFFVSFSKLRLAIEFDEMGEIIFYRAEKKQESESNNETGIWDFKKHICNGNTYYSYHIYDNIYKKEVVNGYNPGKRVILDAHYNKLKEIKLLTGKDSIVTKNDAADGLDFYMYDPTHYILTATARCFIPETIIPAGVPHKKGGCYVGTPYIQEVWNDNVIFEWLGASHPEFMDMSDNAFDSENLPDFWNSHSDRPDYMHLTSLQVLENGDWLCSFRNISSAVCIDRSNHTGATKWIFSGKKDNCNIEDEWKCCGQHTVTFDNQNSEILLFDNQNKTTQTRILKYPFDIATHTVTATPVKLIDANCFTNKYGSVFRVKDSYIVSWGENSSGKLISEISADETDVFSINLSELAQTNSYTFKCYKQ